MQAKPIRSKTRRRPIAKKPHGFRPLQIRIWPNGRVELTATGLPALIVAALLLALVLARWVW